MKFKKLSSAFNGFQRTIRAFGLSDNSGESNGEQSNMSNRVKILSSFKAMHP